MNISLNWLKRYIDVELSVDRISEILTDIGLEVEGVKKVESIRGGLQGIVVGYVTECNQHPNADKLSLTKVDIGEEDMLQIVCGAPNVAAGQKVLVATIGATLYPDNGDPWKIKKGKIRGEESQGMICAEDELGLGNDHSGIIVLPEDTEIGTHASDYYDLEDDYVFDIGLTPNRSDATHHLGVAKDLTAFLKINETSDNNLKDPDVSQFHVDISGKPYTVNVENDADCPRYSGIMLSDIKVGDSPNWMQNHLKSIGVRPINNIVDITNFVLHEMGQPLHAFDADKIAGQQIRVKNLAEGTPFTTLDEQERKLLATDLMICDGEDNPLCMAGIFGGMGSGVTQSTTNIFLESAHFSASTVRQSSTKHLLRTDAAKVFEKGSDPNITVIALKRAAMLMKEHAAATITSEIIDIYPEEILPKEIHVRYSNVNRLIGGKLEVEEIHNILRALNMQLIPIDDNSLKVKVPTDKADVLREVDVIEEILRIYGFNKVPIPNQLKTAINPTQFPNGQHIRNTIANYLSSNGFNEMMGLSLIESRIYSEDNPNHVKINNTSNIHLDIMRPDALRSGLQSVLHNSNHQQSDLRLYELGRTYLSNESAFKETEFLSLFISGATQPESWSSSQSSKVSFYEIKGWVNRILNRLNINKYQTSETELADLDYGLRYHRGPSNLAEFGAVNRKVLKSMGIDTEVYYAIIDMKSVIKAGSKSKVEINTLSKYPSTDRDLALILEESIKFADITAIARKTEKKLITDISLFDIYRHPEHIGEGKKSYAVRFVFQDDSKTLKDKEVDKVMKKMIHNLENQLGAVIRS